MQVLDKGHLDVMLVHGNDKLVVNAARVSFANEDWIEEFTGKDAKLIQYLAKHKHISPFYHPCVTFRIKAPISVQRQALKHKIGTAENSESTRYVVVKDEFYVPDYMRGQSKSNKQGSSGKLDNPMERTLLSNYIFACKSSMRVYEYLVESGVAKEQARELLPLATYTSWVWTMTLAAIAHFIELRDEDHAQFEIREYAKAMRELVTPHFPVSMEALTNCNGLRN